MQEEVKACCLALYYKHRYFQVNKRETHFYLGLLFLSQMPGSFVRGMKKNGKTIFFSSDMPSHVGEFHSINIWNIEKAISCEC